MVMKFQEPGPMEVVINGFLLSTIGRSWYRHHVESMGFRGDERVIDYGSGSGVGAMFAARKLKNGHVTCVDISKAWLEAARKRLRGFGNVDFVQGEICEVGLPDGAYDAVIMSMVLHDVPGHQRHHNLKCLVGKLKKCGKIFLREPVSMSHGIAAQEVRALMAAMRMEETAASFFYMPTMGRTFDATYVKR
jgi:ubiquinone/menaquinone biosynthesis C-methylase UbiE